MPHVDLTVQPKPAHVRTARQVAVTMARRAGLPDEALEDVRLAVGEATGLLIGVHEAAGSGADGTAASGHITLRLVDDDGLHITASTAAELPKAEGQEAREVLCRTVAAEDSDGLGSADLVLAVLTELVPGLSVQTGRDGARLDLVWPASAG